AERNRSPQPLLGSLHGRKEMQSRRHRRPPHLPGRRLKEEQDESRRRKLFVLPRSPPGTRNRSSHQARLAGNKMAAAQRENRTLHRSPHRPLHHNRRRPRQVEIRRSITFDETRPAPETGTHQRYTPP